MKKQYLNYLQESDIQLPMELFIGFLGIVFYIYGGFPGFFAGFIILHIAGFILHIYNLGSLQGNPMIESAYKKKQDVEEKQEQKQELEELQEDKE